LVGELGDLDGGDEVYVIAEGTEEVDVMRRNDHGRVEARQDARPVAIREAAPGDTGEEHVDSSVAERLVDEVRASLVVERDAGDGDVDSPDLATAVGAGREAVEVVARQLAIERDRQSEQELGMRARYE